MVKKEILFGINPVYETLRAGRRDIFKVYITKEKISKRLERILTLADSLKISVETSNPLYLKSISGTEHHQGVGVQTGPYPFVKISDMLDNIQSGKSNPFFLLLDNIMDPHNLGALIRTALCVGVNGVIIPKDRSAQPTPTVSKTSAGALEHICLSRVTNMVNTIKMLKKSGLWLAGMDRISTESIFTCDMKGFNAIIIGGEGKGVRPLVKKHCDMLLSIPQTGPLDSLNASAAGAVVMYETFRQRRLSDGWKEDKGNQE
jgi:23S rRNA (guanosine2251-2'-O)-methyltransferase